ncbi:MAG: creatininase family protein, partial [Anaerolineae bacterium]|nr:creatininase family protein [Anaerolineae bacterium]
MGYAILEDTMAVMTWPEIEKRGREGTVVLWPSTVLEEHGPHLPIAVDLYIGVVLGRLVKERLSGQGIASIVAPPNYWGINNVAAAFPGSFTLRPETLKALLYDTLASLKRWGFERVYLLDLHGDANHRRAMLDGVAQARVGCGTRAMCVIPYRYARYAGFTGKEEHLLIQPPDANSVPLGAFTGHQDIHAGALETSFMQCYYPKQVDVDKAKTLQPTVFLPQDWRKWAGGWS